MPDVAAKAGLFRSSAQVGEWLKPADCKSAPPRRYEGSNPSLCTRDLRRERGQGEREARQGFGESSGAWAWSGCRLRRFFLDHAHLFPASLRPPAGVNLVFSEELASSA